MSNEKKGLMSRVVDAAKVEVPEAAVRVAGRQTVKLAIEPLSAWLAGSDSETRQALATLLRSPGGRVMVGTTVGLALQQMIPKETDPGKKTFLEQLARELRVEALATGGDALADLVMDPLRHVIAGALAATPMPEPEQLAEGTHVEAPSVESEAHRYS